MGAASAAILFPTAASKSRLKPLPQSKAIGENPGSIPGTNTNHYGRTNRLNETVFAHTQDSYLLPVFGRRAIKGMPANATKAHIKKALRIPNVSLTEPITRMTLALIAKLMAI